jgi:hypothetical protein
VYKFTLSRPLNGLLESFFARKLPKRHFKARMLREILAYNTDCMQASAVTRPYFTQ